MGSPLSEEAALVFARSPAGMAAAAAAAAPPPAPFMTAEELRRQAEAEGLALLRSESSASGFQGVAIASGRKAKPYQAQVRRDGKKLLLGRFATAEEAAQAFARSPEGRAAAVAAAVPPETAETVLRQARAEGLTLLRSESNASGFQCVFYSGKARPYKAQVRRGGKQVSLGTFTTAEEAALAFARSPEGRAAAAAAAAPPPAPHMTAEEARRQAEAEGLTLLRSESVATGFQGVSFCSSNTARPYQAKVWSGGMSVSLGTFATAEEAALAVARSPEGKAAAAAAAAPPPPPEPHMTAEEARRQAEAEGLTLLRSESNVTGFKGVSINTGGKARPYKAEVHRGQTVSLGYFATAEEAALAFARTPEGRAAAAAAAEPPRETYMTAEEARRQAEAEGLPLLRSESNASGFKGVSMNGNCKATPYQAKVRREGQTVSLGTFATAEEAALAFARSPEGRAAAAAAAAAAAPPPPPEPHMTAEEARRQAEAEGLPLLRSESSATGFQGVTLNSGEARSYRAYVRRGGKQVHLGAFGTAEEAALAFARSPEGRAAAAAAAAAPPPPPEPHMTAKEARRQAEEEGLTLLRSESTASGYQGVSFSGNQAKPYQANVQRGGTTVTLGFHTAEEAALAIARQVLLEAMALIGRDKTGARLVEDDAAARGDMKRRRLGSD